MNIKSNVIVLLSLISHSSIIPAQQKTAAAAAQQKAAVQPKKSLKSFDFTGAAVLPYFHFTMPKTKESRQLVLLGREASGSDKGTYNGFGGKRDKSESHPVVTASREFAEETEGMIMKAQEARGYIDVDSGNTAYVIANENKKTVTYVTRFPFHVIENFQKQFVNSCRTNQEIDGLATVEWNYLINTIAAAPRDNAGKLIVPITLTANVIHADKKAGYVVKKEQINLRPFMVSSLQSFCSNKSYEAGKNPKIRFYQK